MNIVKVTDDLEKKKIARNVSEALPGWFGIPEVREEYIEDSVWSNFLCRRRKFY